MYINIYVKQSTHAGFDMECRKHVEAEYQRQGINMYPTFCPQKVVKESDGSLTVTAKDSNDKEMVIKGADCVLMATGRKPNTQNLGLEEVRCRLRAWCACVV